MPKKVTKTSTTNFDQKYNLTSNDLALLTRSPYEVKDIVQLSGKPSTNFKDFFARLFTNKVTVVALIIFFGLILCAIIISATSQFSPSKPISNDAQIIISFLPPNAGASSWVDKIVTVSQYKLLQNILDNGITPGPTMPHIHLLETNMPPGYVYVSFNPYDYLAQAHNINPHFILGTNSIGEDNWTRIWYGTLQSLELALLVATVESIIGIAIGAWIGFYAGGKLDNIFMRVVDTISGVPYLLWFILLAFILPPGFWTLFLALTLIGWITPVYQTRMYMIRVKNLDYISAAKTIGISQFKLIFKYGLPNSLGRILSQYVKRIPLVIFAQASLAFLGFSSADDANLGAIINDAKSNLDNIWYILTPTLIIFVITLSLQFVANGVNDALDPKVATHA